VGATSLSADCCFMSQHYKKPIKSVGLKRTSSSSHWKLNFFSPWYCRVGVKLQSLCWWTNSTRGYHPPISQCFDTDMVWYLQFLNNVIINKCSPPAVIGDLSQIWLSRLGKLGSLVGRLFCVKKSFHGTCIQKQQL